MSNTVNNAVKYLRLSRIFTSCTIALIACSLSGCPKEKITSESPTSPITSSATNTSQITSSQPISSKTDFEGNIENVVLPECHLQNCPEILIQRLRSNAPSLDHAVDLYIKQHIIGVVEGFSITDEDLENTSAEGETEEQQSELTIYGRKDTSTPITHLSQRKANNPENNDDSIQKNIKKFFLIAKEGQEFGMSNPISLLIKLEIIKPKQTLSNQKIKMVTVAVYTNTYMGGAHGSATEQYFNYDIEKQSLINLDDIIQAGQRQKFNSLAFETYKRWVQENQSENNLEDYQQTWPFLLSDDFFFADNGLVLQYDEYQIGPYAAGLPRLIIPYEQLQGILKPQYLP